MLEPHTPIRVPDSNTVGAANRGLIIPATLPAAATLTGIRISVTVQSGNISVALYDSSLARVATSGAVACPASGAQTVAFTGNYSAAAGRYYLGLSCDNTTATFRITTAEDGPVYAYFMNSAHPLPATFVSGGASRTPALVGMISGGWTG